MPDVGVLQLKISADAGNASRSLKSLQDRLKAVKDAAANFDTQKVVDGITGIINTVKGDATVSNAVKNLASLLNAVAAFSKIKDIGLKEADINKLATLQTVANGFKLGTTGTQLNKLKEALGGEWNTDQADKARQALETLVGGAKSLEENGFKEKVSAAKDAVSQMTAGTAKEVKSVSNEMQNLGQATGRTAGILSSLNGASSMNPFGRLPQAFYSMQGTSLNETKSFVNQSVQQWRDQAEEAKAATKAVETAQGSGDAVTSLARGLKELNNSVKGTDMARFADNIKALNSALAKGANSYLTLGRLAGSIKKLKESVQGFKLPSFTGLENLAKSLQENFNAENGLKRIAEGILAVKEAGAGFKAPKIVISTSDSSSSGFATTSERVVEAAQAATESISDMKVATVEATEAVNNQGTVNLASEFAETKETVVETRVAVDDMIDSEKTAAETMAEISRAAKDVHSNTVDSGFGTEGAQSFDGMTESAERTTEAIARYNEAMEFARQWNAKKPPQEMSNIETARRLVEEFTAIANTSDKISDLTTKLGFVINDYDKEIEKAEPSERRLNALQLQIDSLVKQIDTLNSKSIRLDFARELTPENLGELSELDRLEQKRSDLVMTLHEEMEANKLSVAQIMTRAGQIDTLTEKIEKLREKEEEEQAVRLSVRETNEMAQRVSQLDMLIAKSEEAKAAYNALINDPNATNSEQIAAALKINKAELEIQRYNELKGLLANVSPEIQKFAQDQLNAGVSASTLRSKLFDLDGELKQKKTDMKGAADGTKSLGQRFNELLFGTDNLSGAMKKMFPSISGLLSRFKQLVKYRMLRAVIKQISDGFKEGYENYYHYSEAIGSGFAPAMDSATSSLLQMKNSIGAAVAPLMQSLVPVLQTVVNWFIEVVNYANQFIALMRGQSTWSRATNQNVKAFDETKKSAKGAGSAIKDLLADWDELNIIQSESGGGSGSTGSKAAEDYLSMFEEVNEFDSNVKGLIDEINENFDDVLGVVKDIGAVIFGWKISRAFKGIIGTLGSLLASLGLVDLEFRISSILNGKYLETGEIGYLVADLLKTLVGGVLMKKVLSTVLKGQYAYLGIPIMLTVNATSRIITLLGDTNVDALSKESIISNIVSALELGGVAGYLAYTAGATVSQAISGGAVATILALSALIGLKADVNAIASGEITEDTIKAKALSALGLSIGATAAAKLLVPGVSTAQALGFGVATGAAATLLTMSATLGVVATTKAIESGITEEVILDDLLSSASMAVGSTIAIKMLTPTSWLASSAAGAGLGLATLGALIGIQATCESVKNDSITADTITKDAVSSLLMGGGVALVNGILVGAGAGAALTVGGLAALATFAALIGIQALLQMSKAEDRIKWGDYEATEEEIKAFIDGEVFSGAPSVKISLAKAKFEELGANRTSLENSASGVLGVLHAAKIGLTKTARADLLTELKTFTQTFNVTSKSYQDSLKIAVSLVPVSDNQKDTTEILNNSESRWKELNGIMTNLANDLTKQFDIAYDKSLDETTRNDAQLAIEKISGMMAQVSDAISSGQAKAKVINSINSQLGNLSGNTVEGLVVYYREQRDALIKEMVKANEDAAEGTLAQSFAYQKLAEYALKEANGNTEDATYKHYLAQAQSAYNDYLTMINDLREKAEAEADKTLKDSSGYEKIRNELLGGIASAISGVDVYDAIYRYAGLIGTNSDNFAKTFIGLLFDEDGTADSAKQYMSELLDTIIQQAYGDSANTYIEAIRAGILSYSDLISDDMFTLIAKKTGMTGAQLKNLMKGLFPNEVVNPIKTWQDQWHAEGAGDVPYVEYDVEVVEDPSMQTPITAPAVNTSPFNDSMNDMWLYTKQTISKIATYINTLNGMTVGIDTAVSGNGYNAKWAVHGLASGGYVRSGDLVMANENGNFEMMGKMGRQPVVANNDQIVTGITRGVESGNDGIVSALNTLINLAQRIERKEIVAKAVPSSAWGQNNQRSAEQYSRVTGG